MRVFVLFSLFVAASAASTFSNEKIIGGSVTTIASYPAITALLYAPNGITFTQECGGSILNQRSVLSAAHCFDRKNVPARWRFRVGSSFAHSGGVLHNINQIIIHPNYGLNGLDSDIVIVRSASTINYVNNAVQPALIPSPTYNLPDNEVVWAAGWGVTELGVPSEQLRHVQVWTISQQDCRQRYTVDSITDNMLCSGVLDVGGRDQCYGDSGGPLYHRGVVVGICSWGIFCAEPRFPGVNVRVSRFSSWIQAFA